MIRSLVFDKDGVILDLVGTWFPVVEKLVDYTLDRLPSEGRGKVSSPYRVPQKEGDQACSRQVFPLPGTRSRQGQE